MNSPLEDDFICVPLLYMLRSHLFDQPSDPSHWLVVRLAAACAQLVIVPSEQEYLTLAGACGKGLFEHYVILTLRVRITAFSLRNGLCNLDYLNNVNTPRTYRPYTLSLIRAQPRRHQESHS